MAAKRFGLLGAAGIAIFVLSVGEGNNPGSAGNTVDSFSRSAQAGGQGAAVVAGSAACLTADLARVGGNALGFNLPQAAGACAPTAQAPDASPPEQEGGDYLGVEP